LNEQALIVIGFWSRPAIQQADQKSRRRAAWHGSVWRFLCMLF